MEHNFVSIDIETLGIDKDCTIIEFGAVMDISGVPLDQLPTFHRYLKPASEGLYQGELYAIGMHAELFQRMRTQELISPICLCYVFNDWLKTLGISGSIQIAGKNFSTFDLPFLDKHCYWSQRVKYKRRILDLGSVFYEYGKPVPTFAECLQACGFEPTVRHDALGDAYDVIRCIRHKYGSQT